MRSGWGFVWKWWWTMLREVSTRNSTPCAMTDKPRSTIIEDNPIGNGGILQLPDSDCRCSHHIFVTRSWITDNGEELLYLHLDFQDSFRFCFRQRRHFHRPSFTCPAVGFIGGRDIRRHRAAALPRVGSAKWGPLQGTIEAPDHLLHNAAPLHSQNGPPV